MKKAEEEQEEKKISRRRKRSGKKLGYSFPSQTNLPSDKKHIHSLSVACVVYCFVLSFDESRPALLVPVRSAQGGSMFGLIGQRADESVDCLCMICDRSRFHLAPTWMCCSLIGCFSHSEPITNHESNDSQLETR